MWTSPNQHAFMAIVAHYISNTGDHGKYDMHIIHEVAGLNNVLVTEELIIDFREVIGDHSGANMAEVVWGTLMLYELTDKVLYACFGVYSLLIFYRLYVS